jgi:hypothetical protein
MFGVGNIGRNAEAFSTPPLMDFSISFFMIFLCMCRDQEEEGPVGAVGNPESSEGFPSGCWNRGVFGAISKALWDPCGKMRVFEPAFHKDSIALSPVAASTGFAASMKAKKGEEKEVIGELSGNIQAEDGIEDERSGGNQRERVVEGSRSFTDIAFEMASRGRWR